MVLIPDSELENPVWYALNQSHSHLALSYSGIKFYNPEYCIFGAFDQSQGYIDGIAAYSKNIDGFYVVGKKPHLPEHLTITKEILCYQMVLKEPSSLEFSVPIKPLSSDQHSALIDLVNLVMPGYFRPKTPFMGNYYGIFDGDKLIAAAGKRMQLDRYTEISSIVTHPDYTRKGFALALTNHCGQEILEEGKWAFLHVLQTNIAAISLYKKCGFEISRPMSFWNIGPK